MKMIRRQAVAFSWLRLRFALLLTLLVTVSWLRVPLVPAVAPEPAAVVEMTNELHFSPTTVTVQVNQTIEWRNTSLLVHTVTADPELAAKQEDVALPKGAETFNSGRIQPAGAFRHTFTVPGTYRYFCIPHEPAGMIGEVVVQK